MKKIAFIALILCFTFSLFIIDHQIKNDELKKIATIEREFATPFVFPEHEKLSNPERMYPLLLETAREAQVNLFRAAQYHRPDQQLEIKKYLLLTNETKFFEYIHLAKGRTLQAKDIGESRFFLSTAQTNNKNQIGQIHFFDSQQLITIQPLEASYDYLPVHGRYFVEAKDDKRLQLFLETLSEKINRYLKSEDVKEISSYTAADLQPPEAFIEPKEEQEGFFFFFLKDLTLYKYMQYILFAVTLLLLIYYIFNTAKQIGILKMHGISNLRLWWIIVGRFITWAVGITALGAFLFILFTRGFFGVETFFYEALVQLGKTYLTLLILSLFCYVYISFINVSQTLKNRKDTQGIFVLNMVVKVVCATALVLMGVGVWKLYSDLQNKQDQMHAWQEQLNNWGSRMKDYGYIQVYPGHSTAYTAEELEAEFSREDSALYKLYFYLNSLGAVYIDSREYEENEILANQHFKGIRSIVVNPNYLKVYSIYDHQGNRIQISEDTEDWILLVPEQYRDREEEIRNYFERDKGIRDFYLVSDKGQEMKIIWTAKDQSIFSFNPEVFPWEGNRILDPIIHVKTEKNLLFVYRGGIKGGGLTDPLKMKLIDQDPMLTYEKIKPKLERLRLDDRVKVVTFHEYITQEFDDLQGLIRSIFLQMVGLMAVFVFLIIQNLLIFFHKHQKRFVVRRLFGIRFFKTYQLVFGWLIVTTTAFAILSLMINRIQERFSPPTMGQTDLYLLIFILSLIVIEILATVFALIFIERRNKIQVVKGGE